MSSENFLNLSIEFNPPRVSVGFRTERQAVQYLDLISCRPFTKTLKLDPQRYGRFVSVRLPSRVAQIEASTTYYGFRLCTKNTEFAKQWKYALILWEYTPNSERNLYLKRDIENEELNALLCIDEHLPENKEPGTADGSSFARDTWRY
ncbi:hypothetical protein E0Z10_g10358 [Xylaria hypoxylon]|uniref:Uncharacterized protein n=1 Tax=Xylaria hypoxylon TaxID=37992 RepID=A0A4Z0Y6A4_9PEZI|nr:hypothetical protein E0Z10_g10358 [Xylaria hypoxylon]